MNNPLSQIIDFHGHPGMWAALGYKAGEFAKRLLSPQSIKELDAEINLVYSTPYSCFIDGFQVASCCTMGKCNLKINNSKEELLSVSVKNLKSGRKLKIILKKEVLAEIKNRQKAKSRMVNNPQIDLNDTKWILSMRSDDLFEKVLNFN